MRLLLFFEKKKKLVIHGVEVLKGKTCCKEDGIEEIQWPSREWETGVVGIGTSLLFVVEEHRERCGACNTFQVKWVAILESKGSL